MIGELDKFQILPNLRKIKQGSLIELMFPERLKGAVKEMDSICNNWAIGEKLPGYLAHTLPEAEEREFADHFQQCKACMKKVILHEVNEIRYEIAENFLEDSDESEWVWGTAKAATHNIEAVALAVSLERFEPETN